MYMYGKNQVHLYVFCNFCGNRKGVRITQSNTFNKKSICSEDSHSKYRRINIKIKCWREREREREKLLWYAALIPCPVTWQFFFFSFPVHWMPWCVPPSHGVASPSIVPPPPPPPNFVALFQCASSYTISTCPLCLHPGDHASSENTGWASRIYCHIYLEHTVHMNCYPDIYLKNVHMNCYCDICLENTIHIFW